MERRWTDAPDSVFLRIYAALPVADPRRRPSDLLQVYAHAAARAGGELTPSCTPTGNPRALVGVQDVLET
jgi:hypothetical protein